MRPAAAAILAACVAFGALAEDYVNVVVRTTDFGLGQLVGTNVTMTPVGPVRRTYGTNLVTLTARTLATDTNGVATFTNTLWGKYDLTVPGTTPTTWRLNLGTNHTKSVSAATLVTDPASYPPDPATNYYTMAQTDALLEEVGSGSGSGTATNLASGLNATNLSLYSPTFIGGINSSNITGAIAATGLGLTVADPDTVVLGITNTDTSYPRWWWTPNELFAYDTESTVSVQLSGVGDLYLSGDLLADRVFGDGSGLTNINSTATNLAADLSATNLSLYSPTFVGGVSVSNMFSTTFNVRDFGAAGDGVTDDSEAFQRAVNQCVTNSGGSVYVPAGTYLLDTWRSVSGGYAQIALPNRSLNDNPIIPIRIYGETHAPEDLTWTTNAVAQPTGGAIVLCTNLVENGTNYCIIGQPGSDSLGGWRYSAIDLHLDGLTFRTTADPTISAVNLYRVGEASVNNCTISAGAPYYQLTNAPTHGTAGLIMPGQGNWQRELVRNVTVMGYHYGFRASEHLTVDNLHIARCLVGIDFVGGYLASDFGYVCLTACRTNILASGLNAVAGVTSQRLNLACVSIENSDTEVGMPAWCAQVIDVSDDYGRLRGVMNYVCTLRVSDTPLEVSAGATNMIFRNLNSPYNQSLRQPLALGQMVADSTTDASYGSVYIGGEVVPGAYNPPRISYYQLTNTWGPQLVITTPPKGIDFNTTDNYGKYLTINSNGVSSYVGFVGNGSGLTNLSASAISGVLTQGQAGVTLDGITNSGALYLDSGMGSWPYLNGYGGSIHAYNTSGGNGNIVAGQFLALGATGFTGDGSGLTNVTALYVTDTTTKALTVDSDVAMSMAPSMKLYGDGSGLTNLSAAAISGVLTQGHSAAVTLSNVVFSGDVYNGLNNGRGYLQAFDYNISKATNATAICLLGDSYVALRHWGPQAAKSIGQFYGYGGIGYCPANTNAASSITGITYTQTGTWTNYGPGSGGVGVNLCHLGGTDITTGKLTIAGICNQIRIHYVQQTGGGTFSFGVDNGTGYSVDTSYGAGAVPTIAVTNATISSSLVSTHTLRITNTVAGDSGVGIAGFEFNNTTYDAAGSTRFHNLGYSGTKCADWTNVNTASWSNALNNLNPKLVLVSLGVNEHSGATNLTEYAGALSALVQQIQTAVSNASVCLVSQSDVSNAVAGPTMGEYVTVMAQVAQSNHCGFVNNYQIIPDNLTAQGAGLVSTDGLHINTAGGALYAKNLVSFLRQQEDTTKSLWMVNRPEADSIFLGRPGAGGAITTGYRNLAFGNYSGNTLSTGYDNVLFGYYAGINLNGAENVLVGSYAGRTLSTGGYNVAIGHKALYLGSSASAFTAIGNQALYNAAAANGRGVGIGFAAGKYETAGTNLYINVWDQSNIAGDKDYSLLYGTFATGAGTRAGAQLTVNGDLKSAGTLTATNGVVLPATATPPALTIGGAQLWSDGTNLCVIVKDGGGTLTTNKLTMSAWP